MSVQERLLHTPVVVVGILAGLFFGVGTIIVMVGLGYIKWGWPAVALGVFAAVPFGVFMALFLRRVRKSSGEPREVIRFNQALKSGLVPSDAPTGRWLGYLESREHMNRPLIWVGPLFFGGMGIMSLVLALTGENPPPHLLPLAIVFLVLAGFYPIWTRRTLSQITRLRAAIETRERGESRI
jgi:hypothetical protein